MGNKKTTEYLDVLDEKGNKTGEIKSKKEAHDKGLWHKSVHVWFLNGKGELLMQLRGEKLTHPNYWDISAAGHAVAGDDSVKTAIKETREELGIILAPEQLKYIGTVKVSEILNDNTYFNNEFNDVYLVQIDSPKFELETDGEVKETRWVSRQEFFKWVEEKRPDLVPHPEEYLLLFKYLENL